MLLLNPKKYQDRNYPDERSKEIMLKTIEWFENKGLEKLNEDYHSRDFTYDFAEFIKEEKIDIGKFLRVGKFVGRTAMSRTLKRAGGPGVTDRG